MEVDQKPAVAQTGVPTDSEGPPSRERSLPPSHQTKNSNLPGAASPSSVEPNRPAASTASRPPSTLAIDSTNTSRQSTPSRPPSPAPAPPASASRPMDAEANAAATALANVAASAHSQLAGSSNGVAQAKSGPTSANFDPAAPHAVDGLPNPLPANYDKSLPICANCATQTTPLWRRSHDSTHILCNACALFFKMKGRPRPISLKTDVIKSRNRSKGKSTSKDRAAAMGLVAAKPISSTASASSSPNPSVLQHPRTGSSKERSESMTRHGDGRKSGPGGAGEEEEHDGKDGRTKSWGEAAMDHDGRKARKVMPAAAPQPPYGIMGYPGYPYPYSYPHPHAHQPYPPPRSRSRSSDPTRRAHSVDARGRGTPGSSKETTPAPQTPGHAPPPFAYPAFHPGAPPPPEGYPHPFPYYPYGPPPAGYPGPNQAAHYPGYPPPHAQPHFPPHPAAALAHAAHQAHQALVPITHAQSDSRSRATTEDPASKPPSARASPSPTQSPAQAVVGGSNPSSTSTSTTTAASATNSPASTPNPLAAHPALQPPHATYPAWYAHAGGPPPPGYPHHLHQPLQHSPLSGPRPSASQISRSSSRSPANSASGSTSTSKPGAAHEEHSRTTDSNGRVTLAPIASSSASNASASAAAAGGGTSSTTGSPRSSIETIKHHQSQSAASNEDKIHLPSISSAMPPSSLSHSFSAAVAAAAAAANHPGAGPQPNRMFDGPSHAHHASATSNHHHHHHDAAAAAAALHQPRPDAMGSRSRRESVSSASPSLSGSSEGGIRSPEAPAPRVLAGWGGSASNAIAGLHALSASSSSAGGSGSGGGGAGGGGGSSSGAMTPDERRGRSERRFDDYVAAVGSSKGKRKEEDVTEAARDRDGDEMLEEVDELEEDDPNDSFASATRHAPSARLASAPNEQNRRMVGVETGLNELRVSSIANTGHRTTPTSAQAGGGGGGASRSSRLPASGASRSRSGVRGESERGRSRVISTARGGSTSTSRARGSSATSAASSSARSMASTAGGGGTTQQPGRESWPPEALAEIARLKSKISELTFLNGLMQSRLGQLDAGVPTRTVTSLTAETPRPDAFEPEDDEDDQDVEEDERFPRLEQVGEELGEGEGEGQGEGDGTGERMEEDELL
ncbi:hypothetical protein JCM3766R1_002137 [Sporobolomyces carnicolor]